MILIGQYDSPFVRRVAIALMLYGIGFDHRPWSTFSDGDRIEPFNPLRRVPTLVLDDGEVLIESGAILDHLDELAGDAALFPKAGAPRRQALRVAALASGLADKAVILVYERLLHDDPSTMWVDRCRGQIGGVLDRLEAERAAIASPYWQGDRIGHADIMVACALRFVREAHPDALDPVRRPALAAHAARCEALAAFQAVQQSFTPPRGKS